MSVTNLTGIISFVVVIIIVIILWATGVFKGCNQDDGHGGFA